MDSLNYLSQAGGPLPIHHGQKHRLASLPGIRERHTTCQIEYIHCYSLMFRNFSKEQHYNENQLYAEN